MLAGVRAVCTVHDACLHFLLDFSRRYFLAHLNEFLTRPVFWGCCTMLLFVNSTFELFGLDLAGVLRVNGLTTLYADTFKVAVAHAMHVQKTFYTYRGGPLDLLTYFCHLKIVCFIALTFSSSGK